MKKNLLTLIFIILSISFPARADIPGIPKSGSGSAFSITQKNILEEGDVASWTIHTPVPGWAVDRITKPIDNEIQVGLMRSPAEQESVLKYERPLDKHDKRFTVEAILYQRNDVTGSIPGVSTKEGLILFKIHF